MVASSSVPNLATHDLNIEINYMFPYNIPRMHMGSDLITRPYSYVYSYSYTPVHKPTCSSYSCSTAGFDHTTVQYPLEVVGIKFSLYDETPREVLCQPSFQLCTQSLQLTQLG